MDELFFFRLTINTTTIIPTIITADATIKANAVIESVLTVS